MVELVGALRSKMLLTLRIAAPSPGAATVAVKFVDELGNPFSFADANWEGIAQSDGVADCVVQESSKTASGCNIYSPGATNFTNPIYLHATGRGSNQPITQDGLAVSP
jgi:hypothetical protein